MIKIAKVKVLLLT